MEELAGFQLLLNSEGDMVYVDEIAEGNKFIALYFGAHWAPPSRIFTETLLSFYKEVNKVPTLEIIFVSDDGDKKAFDSNFGGMPWRAIPFNQIQKKFFLKRTFGVNGIPAFVVLGSDGTLVTEHGREDVLDHGEKAIEIWEKTLKDKLDQ